jgi:hypothetical protein
MITSKGAETEWTWIKSTYLSLLTYLEREIVAGRVRRQILCGLLFPFSGARRRLFWTVFPFGSKFVERAQYEIIFYMVWFSKISPGCGSIISGPVREAKICWGGGCRHSCQRFKLGLTQIPTRNFSALRLSTLGSSFLVPQSRLPIVCGTSLSSRIPAR